MVLCLWISMPINVKDRFYGIATTFTNERMCFNDYKEKQIDSDSAYLVGYRRENKNDSSSSGYFYFPGGFSEYSKEDQVKKVLRESLKDYQDVATIRFNVKNGYGGYIEKEEICIITSNTFDGLDTLLTNMKIDEAKFLFERRFGK